MSLVVRLSPAAKVALVCIVHVVLLYSIIDIYFHTPIVDGVRIPAWTGTESESLADVVVLISVDGLRADTMFECVSSDDSSDQPDACKDADDLMSFRAPQLRRKVLEEGVWGISHAHVPTESRPGHVAMVSGFYEDISAVTTGWKLNPVSFDSLVQRVQFAIGFGSPDIIPMFFVPTTRPASERCWATYSADFEDFASPAPDMLDAWVFDRMHALLANGTLNEQVQSATSTLVFLHLLGMDTAGHGFKPHSAEYKSLVTLVSRQVEQLEATLRSTWPEKRLSFVVTSDHGMSMRGNHGDGDPDNTRTPFIAWGAGIRGPRHCSASQQVEQKFDWFPSSFHLASVCRQDIEQADITPLIASLLNIPVPVNSVGKLPVAVLQGNQAQLTRAMWRWCAQLVGLAARKQELVQQRAFWYSPYAPALHLNQQLDELMQFTCTGNDSCDFSSFYQVAAVALESMDYHHQYFRTPTVVVIVGSYLLLMLVLHRAVASSGSDGSLTVRIPVGLPLLLHLWIILEQHPLSYHLYAAVFYVLFGCLYHEAAWRTTVLDYVRTAPHWLVTAVLVALSFSDRMWASLLPLPLLLWSSCCSLPWFLSTGFLSVFMLFPLPLESHPHTVCTGVLVTVATAWTVVWLLSSSSSSHRSSSGKAYLDRRRRRLQRSSLVAATLLAAVAVLCCLVATHTDQCLRDRLSVPKPNQLVAWLSLLTPAVPFCCTASLPVSIALITLSFLPPFTFLSVDYECLFLLFLMLTLLQYRSHTSTKHGYSLLLLVFISFYGTGNFASMGSFEIHSTYRFITIFSPFTMMFLLVFKLMIPVVLTGAAIALVHADRQLSLSQTVTAALQCAEPLCLYYFFHIRTEGSWRDIGLSISHYAVACSLVVVLVLVGALGHLFANCLLVHSTRRQRLSH